jgi:hypothetical protein
VGLMLSRRLRRWEGSERGRESMAPLIENFPPKYQMHTQMSRHLAKIRNRTAHSSHYS